MESKTIQKYEIVFMEGSVDSCMYDIVSGTVGIYTDYSKPEEKLLTVLKKGDTFGEMGMIEKKPRSATAVALEKTELNAIAMEEFKDYFQDKPEKVSKILHNTSQRIRALTGDFVSARLALTQYVRCKEEGKAVPGELVSKMKKIAKAGK